jgi:hypothetical protein
MTLYDKHPTYAHHEDLFWAHEPYKTIYVLQRILTTVLLVPCWVLYYGILPRRFRPRPSWSISQIVVVKFMKRIGKVVERAGVTWGTRDPTQAPDEATLKETRFVWASPLPDDLRTGIVDDEVVPCKPVGMYVWPKDLHPSVRARKSVEKRGSSSSAESGDSGLTAVDADSDPEGDAADAPPKIVAIYMHGGGYCHYSAHETAGTSRIPRRLVKDGLFEEIYGESVSFGGAGARSRWGSADPARPACTQASQASFRLSEIVTHEHALVFTHGGVVLVYLRPYIIALADLYSTSYHLPPLLIQCPYRLLRPRRVTPTHGSARSPNPAELHIF